MLRRETIEATKLVESGAVASRRPLLWMALAAVAVVVIVTRIYQGKAERTHAAMAPAAALDLKGGAAERDKRAELEVVTAGAGTLAGRSAETRSEDLLVVPGEAAPEAQTASQSGGSAAAADPNSLRERRKRALIDETMDSEQRAREALQQAMTARGAVALEQAAGEGEDTVPSAHDGSGLDAMQQASLALMRGQLAGGSAGAAAGRAGEGQTGGSAGPGARHAGAEAFFRTGGSDLHKDALYSARQRHPSPYVLLQGAFLKGKLLTAIHSELPGMIRGKVTEDVYDTATGAHLLIPMGSFVVGRYSSEVHSGQRRVQIAWTRLNFPDGSFMDLGSMSGGDETGASGVQDRLNRHLGRRIGMGILLSTLTISHEVMSPASQQGFGSAVHRGAGDAIVSLGTESIRNEMDIPPTVEIRQGARFTIHVSRDLVFSEPYRRVAR